ncbi:MAG: flavodoxin family protein [Dehalococcoidales bacterium]|nr:flavodoxin family protein [Dehalococcoidales bacterium]
MKAIGIVGSPRKNGNTELLMAHTLKAIGEEGIETELVRLAGLDIKPCNACMTCKTEERCAIKDDLFPIYIKLKEADGIILGSPVYYGSATGLVKCFMERVGYISRWNGEPLRGKTGGPLVVARRAGKNFTMAQLTLWFQILGFYIPGSSYWNVAIGREKGEVEHDEEGMRTAWNFGKNMAYLIKKLKG